MARYQIRTPERQVMEDVIDTLAQGAWRILEAWDVFDDQIHGSDYANFCKAIHHQFAPSVRTYRLCGYSNICLDEAEKTAWSPDADPFQPSPRDLVYHLFPGDGLETFLDDLVKASMDSLKGKIKSTMVDEVGSILKTVFRAILGQYIYFNPLCGKTEFCAYSSSSPQKVWGRPRW